MNVSMSHPFPKLKVITARIKPLIQNDPLELKAAAVSA